MQQTNLSFDIFDFPPDLVDVCNLTNTVTKGSEQARSVFTLASHSDKVHALTAPRTLPPPTSSSSDPARKRKIECHCHEGTMEGWRQAYILSAHEKEVKISTRLDEM